VGLAHGWLVGLDVQLVRVEGFQAFSPDMNLLINASIVQGFSVDPLRRSARMAVHDSTCSFPCSFVRGRGAGCVCVLGET
jgi:hypothetical protein